MPLPTCRVAVYPPLFPPDSTKLHSLSPQPQLRHRTKRLPAARPTRSLPPDQTNNPSASDSSPDPPDASLKDAILERLNKAREYKTNNSAAADDADDDAASAKSSSAQNFPPPVDPPINPPPPMIEKVLSKEEWDQEKEVLGAIDSSIFFTDSTEAPKGFLDVEARKEEPQDEQKPVIVPLRVAPEPERPENSDRKLSQAEFQAKMSFKDRPNDDQGGGFRDGSEFADSVSEMERKEFEQGVEGGTEVAAGYLQELFTDERLQELKAMGEERKDMRPEDYSVKREADIRAAGADVISVDKEYKPRVSTWGMFPRPDNISKAYGGGKTIDPTKPLEDESTKERRDKEISARLQSYRYSRINANVRVELLKVDDRCIWIQEARGSWEENGLAAVCY